MMELRDKIAIVTGGSRGIGRGIVLRLIEEGAKIAFCFQANSNAADGVLKEINDMGGIAFCKKVDVSRRSEVRSFFRDVLSRYGRLDVVVNNAGIQVYRPFLEHKVKDWHRVLEVNLTGTFNCCQIAGRIMRQQKYGKIVNVSSRTYLGAVGVSSYVASKAGIVGLTKSIAMELGPYNINVNCIAPGAIETEMSAAMPKDFREKRIAITPLRRFGLPEEIGHAVVFLASERSAFVTGEVFHITGGVYG
jgi:3-oxoacyl-[acyl-carrier protein] reductase